MDEDPNQTNPASTIPRVYFGVTPPAKPEVGDYWLPSRPGPSRFFSEEVTPGSVLPQLWAPLVLESLKRRAWTTGYSGPPKPPTLRQRLRFLWWDLLDKWPLQWKDRSYAEED